MTQSQIWTAVLTVIGSSIGAFISVRLAFARFRQERLWDARFLAYRDCIAAVEHLAAVNEAVRAWIGCEPLRMPDDEWQKGDLHARREVDRHANTSTLILCAGFRSRLLRFNEELHSAHHRWNGENAAPLRPEYSEDTKQMAAGVAGLGRDALRDLQTLARADLGFDDR